MPKRAPVYPCTTYVPTNAGQLVPSKVEERDRLPYNNGFEPETKRYVIGASATGAYRVMTEQETGEEMCVGEYDTRSEANDARDRHLASHVEHRRCWLEAITTD